MDPVLLARWQFGITTVYHFFFVPLTISLALLVAVMQTAHYRTGKDAYRRLTDFFGKLFLINFAMGVVTGIVQEFQFGMNWSEYSRMVGDIFGAPLALEALLAFFMESTFLGLWIFGRDRLPKAVHLASIWLAAIGTVLSSLFILVANSFMQHPVGFTFNEARGRAEMTDFWAVLTNPVALVTIPHTLMAAYMVGGAFVMGVAGWHLLRIARTSGARNRSELEGQQAEDASAYGWATKFGAWVMIASGALVIFSGDLQGKVMTDVQPMKMAAAEAIWETETPASFSIFTIGTLDGSREVFALKVPGVTSFLATGSFTGTVQGINPLRQEYDAKYTAMIRQKYGDEVANAMTYTPAVPVTYWTFRLMMGLGFAAIAVGAIVLVMLRRGNLPPLRAGWFWWLMMVAAPLLPLFANSFGWIFTEMGRQPWIVFGLMPTAAAESPGVPAAQVLTTMIGFTLLYGALAVVEVQLLLRAIRKGLEPSTPEHAVDTESDDAPLSFAY
ncbi:cytochrome bd-I ubiquinol oxidase subunit 1 apoprotein [Raineyella antarctica]|uniref:Cytochrome bd-I ubiquinol oxidase subunit 1 apoprotein n=1 Tax=Raineyella antarctica TaxID=1577474 RepID=A0A1G6GH36_9ACTN|nr:cytochrome ubiquinol oxidase subunit I [Raineyella antarctica]SDB80496.1 cytochrome bd-I ubiquinol oxidase subunit 1 apoprotein [Raineyella antarctica]